jgi:GAF domain-containing protein
MQERAPEANERRPPSVPDQNQKEAIEQRADVEILQSISDLIVGDRTLPELFRELVPPLQELAHCDVVTFALYDAKQSGIVTQIWKDGQEARLGRLFPVDESPCGWAWRRQEPISIPDLEQETRFAGVVNELRNLGVRSYTSLPMSTPKYRYGSLGVGGIEAGAQSSLKLRSLQRAAAHLGLAVENRELHFQWQTLQNRQQSLAAIAGELSALELEDLILQTFASHAAGRQLRLCPAEPFGGGFGMVAGARGGGGQRRMEFNCLKIS